MDVNDLARWTRFAAKGGIGKCTALQDCVAQGADDLMFLKDDEVVVLLQLPQEDQYLGYCEGVVGRFHGSAVRFHGKLKKPVFAKRQSAAGSSPSRPISLSPRSPPTNSPGPSSTHNSKSSSSPASSPHVPSISSNPILDTKSALPARISISSVSPSFTRHHNSSHSRTGSTASSSSHYSTHSRPPSRQPEPMPVSGTHARVSSTASSRSVPAGPASDSGSEDTQHVSVLPKAASVAQGTTTTPALTEASSAHSSFLLTPAPALSTFPPPSGMAPASLFQGRARSGSEKLLPREEKAREFRRRSGSENSAMHVRRLVEDRLRVAVEAEAIQEVVMQEDRQQAAAEIPRTGASETSFKSMSVYSEGSVRDEDEELDGTGKAIDRQFLQNDDRGVLREDVSDEEQSSRNTDRAASVSGHSDLSDGGFGIGMTLLREDEDEEEDDSEAENDDREDEETAIGHSTLSKDIEDDVQPPRTPRILGMRVMNPGTENMSESEDSIDDAEDDTVMPRSQSESQSASISTFTSTLSEFPVSSSSQTVLTRPLPPYVRPRLLTNESLSTIASNTASSLAPTEDEHRESDADIYDDYRYSRASSHSPAQHSSRRASRGSTKSGRSRASERPPLPDEETWQRGTEDGTPPRKSTTSERSGSSSRISLELKPGAAAPIHHSTPFMRGAEASIVWPPTDPPNRRQMSTPPPRNVVEMADPTTPGATSIANMSITSPLTRAFRQSDVSVYSRRSQDDEESKEDSVVKSEETSTFSFPRRPPPGSQNVPTEDDQPERSRSPALASSLREKIQNELRSKSPNLSMMSGAQPQLSVFTSRPDGEPNVIVLNESPVSNESPIPTSPSENHLRVASPHSYTGSGSGPPSPLNPGFPPTPSSIASFATTAPLTINKSPSPSPTTPRHPISPPAIPFAGVPPPGRPPSHMQYAQQVHQLPPNHRYPVLGQVPPSESLHSALRLAGQQRATTIHGHVQTDLLTATGPVPISFLLPGMLPPQPLQPRPQPAAPQPPYGQLPPQSQKSTQSPNLQSPPQPTTIPQQHHPVIVPNQPVNPQSASPAETTRAQGRRRMTAPAPTPGANGLLSVNIQSPSKPPSPDTHRAGSVSPDRRSAEMPPPPSPSAAAPLPRANFFPKVGQVRPRSRSFSGFNSEITEKISQSLGRRSQEEGNQPLRAPPTGGRPNSPLSTTPAQTLAPSPAMGSTRGKTAQISRPAHGPSPLSLPPTTSNNNSPMSHLGAHTIVPPNPISRKALSSVKSPDIQDAHAKRNALRQTPSHSSLRPALATISAPSSVTFPPQSRDSGPSGTHPLHADDSSSLRPPSPLKSPTTRQSHESDRTHTSFSRSDISTPPPTNGSSSSSPLARSGSLRSKISISAMRAKGASRNVREGETPTSTNGPVTPTDEEKVQIKDMEFELVRPALKHGSFDLHRNEEIVDPKDVISVRTNDLQDSSSVRSEAMSPGGLSPSTDVRLRSYNTSPEAFPISRKGKAVEASNTVQAHRDRELKWISTMNSSDAAQARKSKKIKKLLIDGVPSSVRYLVWAHLSNSGSKKMPNVYTQLSKRRPALAGDIERDVELSFPDHQYLRDPNGPLVSVLFAYIAMVPDLRYHRGLAIIAGNLLLQSPEEDAFWTFLAMMDSHLRPYFMPTSPQIGVDTSLFIKAAESADPQLAKHVFLELQVQPQELCSVWFTSVFAGTLPLGHLHRVWDMFFYEGVPFLFRVGLSILSLCRRHLLESSKGTPTSHTAYLVHPPPESLLADPEQFISYALSVKLRDDEIRKMRLKLAEAAVKQLRAPRTSTFQPSHPHPSAQGERVRAS